MLNALGVSREQFFVDFVKWAGEQAKSWGLDVTPELEQLTDELRSADPDMALVMDASRKARLDVIVNHLTDQIGQPGSGGKRDQGLTGEQWPPLVRPPVEIDDETLAKWLEQYPDHQDLL